MSPFKSGAQQKYMFAAAKRGEIPQKTVQEFADKTKNFKQLPEHVKKQAYEDAKRGK